MTDTKRAERILAEAKQRFRQAADRESELRRKCLDDLEFLAASPDDKVGQWGQRALTERARDQRPAMVVNRLDQFVLHVANAQRQNRISARVFPVDDKGDIETAEVRQGLIRHIEDNSGGTLAYDTAAFYAVAIGFGYWRLNTEYTDPLTFDQDIKIERIANPFQVYLGAHTMPDGSDAEYGFIATPYTRAEFQAEFPNAQQKGLEWTTGIGDSQGWVTEDEIRVVEYFTKEYTEDELVLMRDGSTKLLNEFTDADEALAFRDADGEPVKRATRTCTLKWYKLNAVEILDETEWPIPEIPIVKVVGHELTVNGQLILKGIVRNMKDAQRQYNLMVSDQTEAISTSKGQITAYEGQLEGHEEQWKSLNKPQVLAVKPTTIAGQPAPLPQRLAPNMSIQAMNEARLMAAEDLKSLTSLYDAALGARSNETSGRGILARQQQSDTANFHFQDNLLRSISRSTKMLVDLMPRIYDGRRVVRIVGEDDSQKVVKINQDFSPEWQQKTGQKRRYDFTTGKYDVVCTAGPTFYSKRQEASASLVELAKVDPGLMATAADIVYRAIDVPYAQEISERRKKALPPQLQDAPQGQPEIPPQVQQQMAALQQQLEALNAYAQQKEKEADVVASKERVEMAKIQAEMARTRVELDSQEAIALLKAEIEGIKMQLDINSRQLAEEAGAAAQQM